MAWLKGTIITDMYVWQGEKNMYDLTYRAGTDIYLVMMGGERMSDYFSPTAKHILRRAIHNVAYTIANSARMQGDYTYGISPWAIWLTIVDIVIGLLIIGGTAWIILRTIKTKNNQKD